MTDNHVAAIAALGGPEMARATIERSHPRVPLAEESWPPRHRFEAAICELALAHLDYLDRRASTGVDDVQALVDDVHTMLVALGLSDHARPGSCHRVVQDEILPAIRSLSRAQADLSLIAEQVGVAGSPGAELTCEILHRIGEMQQHERARFELLARENDRLKAALAAASKGK